jgi:antitoxin component YwqK of YwqJK toxin-antitoxin module
MKSKNTMKNYITIFLSSIFLIACSPKEVSFETLQNRNNIFYEVNVREPFTGIAFTMYENGQMKKEAEFKNGLLHGNYTEWYENGQIKESRKHSKNLFDGKNEMFEKNGDKISEINYKNGEMNGKYFGN